MNRSPVLTALPDLPLLGLVSAATGADLDCWVDPLGSVARVSLPSGAALRVAAGPSGALALRVHQPATPADGARLDAATRRRDELDVLCRVADLLHLAARLSPGDVVAACGCPLALELGDGAEDLVSATIELARSRDLDADGGEVSPLETFVDLALAARELRQLALGDVARAIADRVECISEVLS